MMQLHQDYNEFIENNTKILVIGPESADKFKDHWEENNFKFYGIADEQKTILKAYEQKINLLKLGRMPAQMLIDKDGVLRYAHYGKSMKDIPENKEILDLIKDL